MSLLHPVRPMRGSVRVGRRHILRPWRVDWTEHAYEVVDFSDGTGFFVVLPLDGPHGVTLGSFTASSIHRLTQSQLHEMGRRAARHLR